LLTQTFEPISPAKKRSISQCDYATKLIIDIGFRATTLILIKKSRHLCTGLIAPARGSLTKRARTALPVGSIGY
jgi:hypothetical protein